MKLLLFLLGICVALFGTGTRVEAQNYPWCAIYGGFDDGGTNCGFITLQQCMDTARGMGNLANRIRSTFPRLDRVRPSKREVALLKHNPPRKEAAKGGLKSFILVLIYSHYGMHAPVNAWQYIPFAHVVFAGPRKMGVFS